MSEPIVYVATGSGHGMPTLHNSRDCVALKRSKNVTDKPLSVYPHRKWCSRCCDDD